MPFKLKLKRSKQYNVVSKNLFVISVELLDNTTVECTLSSQSSGQECLSNVCQRLGLQQPQYFGLRFLSRKGTFWWVDLERPLKRQLDKYAQEGFNLYLGVMFYVSDVHLLHDEVTRYHYFLQLKTDIIDGRLQCSQEQAILLASYSLQAEFGDHDLVRHTTEYLNNFVFLPKHMTSGKENKEAIMEQAIIAHQSLQGLSPSLAEIYYIMEAQQLEGYGRDCFPAKDHSGSALYVGVSLTGIFVQNINRQQPLYFQWNEIINLVHHKRCFSIECHHGPKMLQFYMEDSHYAKYVWKMSILQHRFYTKNEALARNKLLQEVPLEKRLSTLTIGKTEPVEPAKYVNDQEGSNNHLQASQESLDELEIYHTGGSYSEHLPLPTSIGDIVLEEVQQETACFSEQPVQQNHPTPPPAPHPLTNSLQSLVSHSVPQTPLPSASLGHLNNIDMTSPMLLYQQHCFSHSAEIPSQTRQVLLPSYRQAPDYETALKQKYGVQSSSMGDISISSVPTPSQSSIVATDSQGDIIHSYHQLPPFQSYSHYKNYTDLSHLESNSSSGNMIINDSLGLTRTYDRVSAPNLLLPPMHTYSTPELTSQGLSDFNPEHIIANVHLYYQYKPPPPYPYRQRSSSSTPDLTRNHQRKISSNSPDLVSRRNVLPSHAESDKDIFEHGQASVESSSHLYMQSGVTLKSQPTSVYIPSPLTADSQETGALHNPNCKDNAALVHSLVTSQQSQEIYHSGDIPLQVSVIDSTVAHIGNSSCSVQLPNRTESYNGNYDACGTIMQLGGSSSVSEAHQAHWRQTAASQGIKVISGPSGVSHQAEQQQMAAESYCPQENASSSMGPMMIAAMNGLTLSRPDIIVNQGEENKNPKDVRIQMLENRLAEGQVFMEFEQIIKRKSPADFTASVLPENLPRNRFKDVLPYEENRVRLTPSKENRTGYINSSHINVTVRGSQKMYIAAQGPLPNTVYSFWQMIWEHHVSVIVMLTEVQEQGREKCHPYWPQDEMKNNTMQCGDFQIIRNCSMSSCTYITCSLTLSHGPSRSHRSIWHIQYTDWPDHSCPQDIQGFINFMGEIDAVRRLASNQQPPGRGRNAPIVVHCSAGVGRSGVVILCDIMLYSMDHNQPIDMPKVLTQLRLQRMLTVQTLAQYKFVYSVLIQYLKSSRLI